MKYLLVPLFLLCLTSTNAFAQSTVSPVHGWLIGSSTLSGSNEDSCILFNQFSDGSSLRFTIKGNAVQTITVIYRQNVFNPDLSNNYETTLEMSGNYRTTLDGYAYSSNTLTITPPNTQVFYDELKRNSRLSIKVPASAKTFNLRNVGQRLKDTKNCRTNAVAQNPVKSLNGVKEIKIFADLSLPKRNTIAPEDTWRASRGERMGDIVKRWSEQSGRPIEWSAPSNPILKQDFVYQGRRKDAMEKLFEVMR